MQALVTKNDAAPSATALAEKPADDVQPAA
jgi:hypothetical protein